MSEHKCECPIMPRIERLEHHMFGERESNTPGIHPIMFGDGAKDGGIVQDIRDIKWYGRVGLWIVTILGGAILVTLGNLVAMKISGSPVPPTAQKAAPVDDAASAAAKTHDATRAN